MANISNFSSNNPNPITGVFGRGQRRFYVANATFTVPTGVTAVRVRMWGAGGNGVPNGYGGHHSGGGGGFTYKVITGLTPGASIAITVGTTGAATTSFGAYCSATGGGNGSSGPAAGGTGSGGDVNTTGGNGGNAGASSSSHCGGGGAASYFGNGGSGSNSIGAPGSGGAGAGGGNNTIGGASLFGIPPVPMSATTYIAPIQTYFQPFSIDYIGTGPGASGGVANNAAFNGGGAGATSSTALSGGFPGGGGVGGGGQGGRGFLIAEW